MLVPSGLIKDWKYVDESLSGNEIKKLHIDYYIDKIFSSKEHYERFLEKISEFEKLYSKLNFFETFKYRLKQIKMLRNKDFDESYSPNVLSSVDIRPSLISDGSVEYDGFGKEHFFSIFFKENVCLFPDINVIRFDNFNGETCVIKSRVTGLRNNEYFIETDNGSAAMTIAENINLIQVHRTGYPDPEPNYKLSYTRTNYNIQRKDIELYLDACMRDKREIFIGGLISDGVLRADLFRDERNAFDVYLKV